MEQDLELGQEDVEEAEVDLALEREVGLQLEDHDAPRRVVEQDLEPEVRLAELR